jgi:hypothetical protein
VKEPVGGTGGEAPAPPGSGRASRNNEAAKLSIATSSLTSTGEIDASVNERQLKGR